MIGFDIRGAGNKEQASVTPRKTAIRILDSVIILAVDGRLLLPGSLALLAQCHSRFRSPLLVFDPRSYGTCPFHFTLSVSMPESMIARSLFLEYSDAETAWTF